MIELAGIIILGILAQWVAWKLKIPAILPLILIGLLVGPIAAEFLSDDGTKWIEPIWNGENGLFPGESLYYFVSLAISIILFEGGLTLKRSEIKNVGPVITKLITLGSAVTFFGAGILAHLIFGLSWDLAFLFSGLIIVTGPTVITPILRNIPLKKDISTVLKYVVSLSTVLLVFVESEIFAHESGLLAVVVMGMVLGNGKLQNIKELLYFKESLSVLLISILFILLAANINIEDLMLLYTWKTAALFAAVVFVIRPAAVFLSTMGSKLKTNEKVFISWVGPRGIVAAGIASLFGSKLLKQGVEGAEYITPLVFMIVLGTVLLNATTARLFAKIVGVFLKKSEGILIVGASKISRLLGHYLETNGRHVVLIDSNEQNVAKAKELGLEALSTNIYSETLTDNIELNDVGYLMALTGNPDINKYAINKFSSQFGENGSFRLVTAQEMLDDGNNPKEGLFSHKDDFTKLSALTRKHPSIQEIDLEDQAHYEELISISNKDEDIIPLFIKDSEGELHIISSYNLEVKNIEEGSQLVYLGKPFDVEEVPTVEVNPSTEA